MLYYEMILIWLLIDKNEEFLNSLALIFLSVLTDY